jgi:hypothetical protein
MAELEYAVGRSDAAFPHNQRSLELAEQLWGAKGEFASCELMAARIALQQEQLASAQELVQRMRARLARCQVEQPDEPGLSPPDAALLELVDLGSRNADDAEWDALEQRTERLELQPHEKIEMLEGRALCAYRRGLRSEAQKHFARALQLNARTPNLLGTRVARAYARLFEE